MGWFSKITNNVSGENRHFERVKPEAIFLVEVRSATSKKARLGQGKDLSQGGIRFATSAFLKKGERVTTTMYFPKNFPGPRTVEASAIVQRVFDPGTSHRLRVACEFQAILPAHQQTLSSYLEWTKTQDLTLAG